MKRPLRNMALLFAGDAGSRVIGFVAAMYVARVLEPAGFGMVNIGMAVLGYLLLAASPGIQVLEMRNVAILPDLDAGRIGAVLALRLVLATLLWAGTALLAALLVDDPDLRTVIVLSAAALIPVAVTLDWFFLGREDGAPVTAARLAGSLVYAAGVGVAVRSAGDVQAPPLLFATGALVTAALLALAFIRRFGTVPLRWDPDAWRRILVAGLPVGLATFLGQHVVNLPPIVLGMSASVAAAGEFSAAMKVVVAFLILDRLIGTLFLPVVSRAFAATPSGVPLLYGVVLKTVAVIALPLGILGTILAEPVIGLVYGTRYAGAVMVLRILVWYAVLTLLNSVHVATLIAARQERRYTIIMVLASTVLLTLVVGLTLPWGAIGSAAGVVGGELAALLLLSREAAVRTGTGVARTLVRPLGAALLMGASAIATTGWTPFASAALSSGVFLAGVVLLRGIGREELRFLRERLV